jgi:2-oxoglutarate dehydrogenase E2 component (dihydrolipoamide succinyltransferase)
VSTNIVVPELGESVHDARIARWLKQAGDAVAVGETIVELETEKTNLEVAATRSGVLARVLQPEGADVKIGDVLAVVEAAPAAAASPDAAAEPAGPESPAAAGTAAKPEEAASPERSPARAEARVEGAVRGGRVEERVRLSKRRLTIARRLVEAQQTAAMLTTFNDVDMSELLEVRRRGREAFEKRHGVPPGLVSFFVRASVVALREHPWLNAEVDAEDLVVKRYYDIGVAIGAEEGLVVPVLRDADGMSFARLELAIRDFARRAAERALTLDDLRGGTFTITNGGVYGSLLSTPILNPPQVAILGLHRIEDRPRAVDGQVVVRPMMNLALTYDHRVVDGREAVRCLARVKTLIEDPGQLLLEG